MSPVLNTIHDEWEHELACFWEGMRKVFKLTANKSCGSHVHVTPESKNFSLEELKKVAFAIITREQFVRALLPSGRNHNVYCRPNTKVSLELRNLFQNGKDTAAFQQIRLRIMDCTTKAQLLTLMQGTTRAGRYAIWNFKNVLDRAKTIEFRGGPHLKGPVRTNWWVVFVLAFISLAMNEVCISVVHSNIVS